MIGSGGHARVIASFLEGDVTFVAETPKDGEIGSDAFFDDLASYANSSIYIGVGDNVARRSIFDRLRAGGVRVATCVAPTAWIARDAQVGEGAVICAGAVIGSRARVGENVIVNTLTSVDHDCIVGDDSQLTARVTLGGTVTVGSNCFFGIGSAVIPNTMIGSHVRVMAGSVVVRSLDSGVTAGGNPARVMSGG